MYFNETAGIAMQHWYIKIESTITSSPTMNVSFSDLGYSRLRQTHLLV